MIRDALKLNQHILEARDNIPNTLKGNKSRPIQSSGDLLLRISKLNEICLKHQQPQEPIRTIHHFSCTGGTLITKCIAAMSNVLVLNEVDPLSEMTKPDGKAKFTPTDMVALLRQGNDKIDQNLVLKIFLNDINLILQEQSQIGTKLILRDHSHSYFLFKNIEQSKPTFLKMFAGEIETLSLVTVRNPLDSFISMKKQGWHTHFSPSTFEEYCRRYILFLEEYENIPLIKYEDFVQSPFDRMREICQILKLDFNPEFENVFSAFDFSGDSGRGGDIISQRPSKSEIPEISIKSEISKYIQEPYYLELNKILKY